MKLDADKSGRQKKRYRLGKRDKPAPQGQHSSRMAPGIEISLPASAAYKATLSEHFQLATLA